MCIYVALSCGLLWFCMCLDNNVLSQLLSALIKLLVYKPSQIIYLLYGNSDFLHLFLFYFCTLFTRFRVFHSH